MGTCKITAVYPLFGDGDGRVWMETTLTRALNDKRINAFEVVKVDPGAYGIQYVHFDVTVDKSVVADTKEAEEFVNELIGDTDIQNVSIATRG